MGSGKGRHEGGQVISCGTLYMVKYLVALVSKSILLNREKKKSVGEVSEGHKYERFLTLGWPSGVKCIHVIRCSGSHLTASRREQNRN